MTYQQRLDKVLSKFDCKYVNNAPYIKLTSSTHIVYFIDKFHLRNDGAEESIKISLDTVESLLKDLESE